MIASTRNEAAKSIGQAITAFHGVRYLVADVKRSIDFYTTHLGFSLEHRAFPPSRPLPGDH